MTRTLRSLRIQGLQLAAVASTSLLAASAAHAQWGGYPVGNTRNNSQLVFEWQGNVDRETQINVGRSNVSVRGTTSNESRGRFVTRGALPRGSGTLYVQRLDGRGSVDVIQQPGNGYGDGIIRIRDNAGGSDFYAIRVYWQSNGTTTADRRGSDGTWDRNGGYDRNGDYDRDGGYDRSGRYDRDGDGDYDRADRRVQQAERKAEQAQRKAQKEREKARRKAEREEDREHHRDHGRGRGRPW